LTGAGCTAAKDFGVAAVAGADGTAEAISVFAAVWAGMAGNFDSEGAGSTEATALGATAGFSTGAGDDLAIAVAVA
jgi:hypothetical protein